VTDTATIRREVAEALLDRREIEAIALHPHPYRTSHWLAGLEVTYADGSFESLVLKDLGPDSLGRSAGEAKPAFAHDPLREIEVYRNVLSDARLGTAAFRGAVVDASRRRFWLVLERVEATELWQLGSPESWCRVAAWLAGMHSQLRDVASDHFARWTPDYVAHWISRASEFCSDTAVAVAARRSAELTERLVALPAGFVHGELYASNVLVDERSGRVCPIDWEMAGVGPLLLDLAALTSGAWTVGERREIAAAYWRRAQTILSLDELLAELDVCRLYIALQWLGWSRDWKPPPEHDHDWLADVRVLVEEVGLA
jgi:aminoglycoside phosphotransferase (APT) family kinase protein